MLSLFKSFFRAALTGVVWALLALYLFTQVIELGAVIQRDLRLQARPLAERIFPLAVSPYPTTPALMLLNLEWQQGLLSAQQHQLALQIQGHAVETLRREFTASAPVNRQQALEFLTLLGRYIDKHYIYQTSVPLGLGLISGVLDCDMRVFLYLSVVSLLNLLVRSLNGLELQVLIDSSVFFSV